MSVEVEFIGDSSMCCGGDDGVVRGEEAERNLCEGAVAEAETSEEWAEEVEGVGGMREEEWIGNERGKREV